MAKIDRTKFKATPLLPMLGQYIGMQYTDLKDFVSETSNSFKDRLDSIEDLVAKEVEKHKGNQEYIDHLYDAFSDDHYKYSHTYSQFFFNAMFVSSVSLFEYFLKRVCGNDKGVEKIKARTSYIGKCKIYITSIIGVDLTPFDSLWGKLELYYKTRNTIVHEMAHIKLPKGGKPFKKQDVYKFISQSPYIKLEQGTSGFKITDKQFIIDFTDLANDYLTKVIQKIMAEKQ